jgi:predicted nucleic acid-binding protein
VLFSALLDANVLVPPALTDTLLRIAERGIYRPLWSEDIFEEVERTIRRIRPDIADRFPRRLAAMKERFEDAMVTGHSDVVPTVTNDPKDRHVLAAAILGRADVIVTFNLRHFPPSALTPFDIEAQHPDVFLGYEYDLEPDVIADVIACQSADTGRGGKPALTVYDVLDSLATCGVPQFAERLRVHFTATSR